MRILLVNDDGIDAPGIEALYEVLSKKDEHEIYLAAPAKQQSGMSQAISVHHAIRVDEYKTEKFQRAQAAWKIYGTPADCVKLALEVFLCDDLPDLVISGINDGSNLGTDVLYSGTVGAALEGYLHGISAVAVSIDAKSVHSFTEAAMLIADKLSEWTGGEASLYNINFPVQMKASGDFSWTTLGRRDYHNAFRTSFDAEGHVFYQMGGTIKDELSDPDADVSVIKKGYISVTPLQADLTDYSAIEGVLDKRASIS